MTDFSIARGGDANHPVLTLRGEIDMATKDCLIQAALPCLHGGASVVTLDFSQVGFIDSTGLGALVTLIKIAKHAEVRLAVTNLPDRVAQLLTLTGLNALFGSDSDGIGRHRRADD